MNKSIRLPLAAAIAAALLPTLRAHADTLVMDTGAPASGAASYTFNSSQFFADEFSIAAGETVTTVGAYLEPGTGTGTAFTFDVYSASSIASGTNTVTRLNNNGYLVASVTATYTGTGWNTAALNWTPTQSGNYWLAIEASSPTSLEVPTVGSQPNAPAGLAALGLDVASGGGGKFAATTTGAAMEISAVPLPGTAWLMVGGLGSLAALMRRKRPA